MGVGWGGGADKFPLEVIYELNPELREAMDGVGGTVDRACHGV